MKGIRRVSTRNMSRPEWLARRRNTIGGSDAAAIVGLSRYGSQYSVFMDKTGRLPDKPDTEAMRQGRDLEEYVSQRFEEETGKKVRRLQAMLYNPLYPFAHADVDRMVCGEDAGLECKTTSTLDVKQFRGVEFPEKYYAQCVHYMAVTGCERWYLAVLVFGRGFFVYTLERDQAEIDALMAAEQGFWAGYVETDTPPGPDGSDATTEAMQTIYSDSRPEERTLFGRDMILDEYCTWLFDILFTLENQVDIRNYSYFQGRYCGRVGELILNVWLCYQVENGRLQKSDIKVLPYLYVEHVNWWKKGKKFLRAKFLHEKYEVQ